MLVINLLLIGAFALQAFATLQDGHPTCTMQWHTSGSVGWVEIFNKTTHDTGTGADTLAGGLLDNLRGDCGWVTSWLAGPVNGWGSAGYWASFEIPLQTNAHCIEKAISQAEGQNVQCQINPQGNHAVCDGCGG